MPTDVATSSTSSDDRRSLSLQALNTLSIQTIDAIEQIKGLFQGYQCIETLVMPRGTKPIDLALSDRALHTLLAALNEPMRRQIDEAQEACSQLLNCIKQEQVD